MKKTIYLVVLGALCTGLTSLANPTVSNIRVSQRENTKLVDILYDVSFTEGTNVSIFCEISMNAGATFDIPASSFTGDGYGALVNTGTDRLIVWNAGIDWNENYSDQMMVRITATPPRFIVHGNGTITDTRSGLIWNCNFTSPEYYSFAYTIAYNEGWRIPTLEEFEALADSDTTSGLPYGHPFFISSGVYWTASIEGLYVNPYTGGYIFRYKGFSFYVRESYAGTNNAQYPVPYVPVDEDHVCWYMLVKEPN